MDAAAGWSVGTLGGLSGEFFHRQGGGLFQCLQYAKGSPGQVAREEGDDSYSPTHSLGDGDSRKNPGNWRLWWVNDPKTFGYWAINTDINSPTVSRRTNELSFCLDRVANRDLLPSL